MHIISTFQYSAKLLCIFHAIDRTSFFPLTKSQFLRDFRELYFSHALSFSLLFRSKFCIDLPFISQKHGMGCDFCCNVWLLFDEHNKTPLHSIRFYTPNSSGTLSCVSVTNATYILCRNATYIECITIT